MKALRLYMAVNRSRRDFHTFCMAVELPRQTAVCLEVPNSLTLFGLVQLESLSTQPFEE